MIVSSDDALSQKYRKHLWMRFSEGFPYPVESLTHTDTNYLARRLGSTTLHEKNIHRNLLDELLDSHYEQPVALSKHPANTPFSPLLMQLIPTARTLLLKKQSTQVRNSLQQCMTHFELCIVHRLSEVTADTLYAQYQSYVAEGQLSIKDSGTLVEFISTLRTTWFSTILRFSPMLRRIIPEVLLQVVNDFSLLFNRLAADRSGLNQAFGIPLDASPTDVLPTSGDRHNGGLCTYLLRFSSNHHLYYKPTSSKPQMLFQNVNDALSRAHIRIPSMSPYTWSSSEEYHWQTAINHREVTTETEAHDYYFNAGVLAVILYFLGGTDIHYQNIVANGRIPTIVDFETIAHPDLNESPKSSEQVTKFFNQSLFRTGLFPVSLPVDLQGILPDYSGLGCIRPTQSSLLHREWRMVGSGYLGFGWSHIISTPKENICTLHGEALDVRKYVDDVVSGIRLAWAMSSQQRFCNTLLTAIEETWDVPCFRILIRLSQTYQEIRMRLCSVDALCGPSEYSTVGLASLLSSNPLIGDSSEQMLEKELEDLLLQDIPRFPNTISSTTPTASGGLNLANCKSPIDWLQLRCCAMTPELLESQIEALHRLG